MRRICIIGDDLVAGLGDGDGLGWAERLARRERKAGRDVVIYPLGVAGETTAEVGRRWRAECERRLAPEAGRSGLVFAFGLNDLMEQGSGRGVRLPLPEALIAAGNIISEANAWVPTLWVGPAPVYPGREPMEAGPGRRMRFGNERLAALNGVFADLAYGLGVPYLDLFNGLQGEMTWRESLKRGQGVHPDAEGHALIARMVSAWPAWRRWFRPLPKESVVGNGGYPPGTRENLAALH